MAAHKQNVCVAKEPSTQLDACICEATERGKCSPPDSSCRHRAVIAGSGPLTVQKAHAYDTKLAIAADKARHQVLAKCNSQRARCPHKAAPVPVAADADQGGNGPAPTGEGSRGDCEIAQQVNSCHQGLEVKERQIVLSLPGPDLHSDRSQCATVLVDLHQLRPFSSRKKKRNEIPSNLRQTYHPRMHVFSYACSRMTRFLYPVTLTLIYERDRDIPNMYQQTENKRSRSRRSTFRARKA